MICDGPYRGERVGYCHLQDVDNVIGINIVKNSVAPSPPSVAPTETG
jgi:hypothetical protein